MDLYTDEYFMKEALKEAHKAFDEDEVPVGAIIVSQNQIIARGYNQSVRLNDFTAHAEMIAITQAAGSVGDWRLEECTLYATLEPCPMCAGAILQARIPRVVFGAIDPKGGGVVSMYELLSDDRLNHKCELVSGVMGDECGQILTSFFRAKRALGKK